MNDTKPVKTILPDQALQNEITRFASQGWQVISFTGQAVQLRKPKQWSVLLLAVGTVGLVLGFGIIFLLLAILDYALKSDRLLYFTAENAARGTIAVPTDRSEWVLLGVGILITIPAIACLFLILGG